MIKSRESIRPVLVGCAIAIFSFFLVDCGGGNNNNLPAPSDLQATAISSSQIDLSWTDNSIDEDGFEIERKDPGGKYTKIFTTAADINSWSDSGIVCGTIFYYRIRAFNIEGYSDYSNDAFATTNTCPTSAPTAPANLQVLPVSISQIDISWTDNSNNEDGFKIERKVGGASYEQIGSVGIDITSYSDTGLTCGTDYYYRVRAYNGLGDSDYCVWDFASTITCPTIPNIPSNLQATAVSSSQINLSWFDNSNDEDGFKIERKIGYDGTYALAVTVSSNINSYSDTNLTSGVTYFYRVSSFNSAGNSGNSNESFVSTFWLAKAISSGGDNSCALAIDGRLKCWGDNMYYQLGANSALLMKSAIPIEISGISDVISNITIGGNHICILTNVGGVKCWGNNNGSLGNGTFSYAVSAPVDVIGLSSGVSDISAGSLFNVQLSGGSVQGGGEDHTCSFSTGGGAKCWGGNTWGELGDGTNTPSSVPRDVSGLTSGVAAISASSISTCALLTSGGVKCWGAGNLGGAGNSNTPIDVPGITNGIVAVSTSVYHSCGLTIGGGVKCWGDNTYGQLGNGNNINSNTPVDVYGLSKGRYNQVYNAWG